MFGKKKEISSTWEAESEAELIAAFEAQTAPQIQQHETPDFSSFEEVQFWATLMSDFKRVEGQALWLVERFNKIFREEHVKDLDFGPWQMRVTCHTDIGGFHRSIEPDPTPGIVCSLFYGALDVGKVEFGSGYITIFDEQSPPKHWPLNTYVSVENACLIKHSHISAAFDFLLGLLVYSEEGKTVSYRPTLQRAMQELLWESSRLGHRQVNLELTHVGALPPGTIKGILEQRETT